MYYDEGFDSGNEDYINDYNEYEYEEYGDEYDGFEMEEGEDPEGDLLFEEKLGLQSQAEFKDRERVNLGDQCGGSSIELKSGKLSELENVINNLLKDPIERFKRFVGAVSTDIKEKGIYNLDVSSRNYMCSKVDDIMTYTNVKFLNPTGYVLGYIVSKGGSGELHQAEVDLVFQNLSRMIDESVKRPDVIRYGRFWNKVI